MICTGCGEDKPVKARGLCAACYTHLQKYGTTQRVKMKRGMCTVEGCEKAAHGRGLCHMHLRRERTTGTLADPRIGKPEPLTHHPLYPQWIDFQRSRNPRPVVSEWKDDFEIFLAGVGTRPTKRHRLYRRDKDLPMGPGNFEWRLALVEKEPGEDKAAYEKRYRQAHRVAYHTDHHTSELQRRYGITSYDHQEMFQAQGGVCAICGNPETDTRKGTVKGLAVDHDHRTKKVRALLCTACNTGLGKFRDDPDLLIKAIAYLAKHGIKLTS